MEKKRNNDEQKLQIALCNYVKYALPEVLYFAVPNGGAKSMVQGALLKKMGVKAGVSDMLFFWLGGMGAIELKAPNGRPSDSQIAFGEAWTKRGGNFVICYSLEDCETAFRAWGLLPKYKLPIMQSSERIMLQQVVAHEMYRRD